MEESEIKAKLSKSHPFYSDWIDSTKWMFQSKALRGRSLLYSQEVPLLQQKFKSEALCNSVFTSFEASSSSSAVFKQLYPEFENIQSSNIIKWLSVTPEEVISSTEMSDETLAFTSKISWSGEETPTSNITSSGEETLQQSSTHENHSINPTSSPAKAAVSSTEESSSSSDQESSGIRDAPDTNTTKSSAQKLADFLDSLPKVGDEGKDDWLYSDMPPLQKLSTTTTTNNETVFLDEEPASNVYGATSFPTEESDGTSFLGQESASLSNSFVAPFPVETGGTFEKVTQLGAMNSMDHSEQKDKPEPEPGPAKKNDDETSASPRRGVKSSRRSESSNDVQGQPVSKKAKRQAELQETILDLLSELHVLDLDGKATKHFLGRVSGYSNTESKTFKDAFRDLEKRCIIYFNDDKKVGLTETGAVAISKDTHPAPSNTAELHQRIIEVLSKTKDMKVAKLQFIWNTMCDGEEHGISELGALAGYTNVGSAGYRIVRQALEYYGLAHKPSRDTFQLVTKTVFRLDKNTVES
jgi:hypothetical protein